MRIWIAIVVSVVFALNVQGQNPPLSPAPVLKLVKAVEKEKGQIIFQETVTRTVPVQVQEVAIVNGQQVTRVVTKYTYVQEQRLQSINVSNSRVITPDGKQLPIDEVWRRVKANSVVAVSGDGNTPAAAFLNALNPETLIVISPQVPNIAPPPPPMVIPPPKRG